MQKLIFALLLLLPGASAFSQETEEKAKVKMTTSPAYENDKRRTFIRNMIRDKAGNVYLVKVQYKVFGKSELIVEKYSSDLKQRFSKELVIRGTNDKDLDYLAAYTLAGEPHIFSSYYNKDKDTRYLFISKLLDNGLLDKPKKISELDDADKNEGKFTIHFSRDSARMLVVNHLPTKRKEKAKFSFVVLDPALTEIWKAEATLPFETRDVALSDFAVDNENRVFVLASADNDSKSSKDADVIQEIFMYENGAKGPKRYVLDLKGKLITALDLHEDKSGDLIAVGTYASSKQKNAFFSRDRTSPLGTVLVKINRTTGEIGSKSVNQFKKKTFEFMKVKESKVEDGKGINNMRLERSWIDANNNVNLDLEQNYVVVTTSRSGNFTTYHYHYHSEAAMLVKYSPDGKVTDEIIVPKAMTSTDDETGLRHILARGDKGEAYFVYNDSPKNWGKKFEDVGDVSTGVSPESGGLSFKKKPDVVLCTVTPDGKKTYARLFNFKKDDVFLNTEASLKYSDKAFVVVASYYRDFKIVKIEF